MGIYYIKTQDNAYYELDSTSDINVSFPGRATDFPLEDGESASDHYINENKRVTFSGIISDVKLALTANNTRAKTTDDYVNGLLKAKASRQTFTVFWSEKLDPIENCVFESLEVSQDKGVGTSGTVSAYRINFTAKEIRFGEAAQVGLVEVPAEVVEKALADKSQSSGNTQSLTQSEEIKVRDEALEAKETISLDLKEGE